VATNFEPLFTANTNHPKSFLAGVLGLHSYTRLKATLISNGSQKDFPFFKKNLLKNKVKNKKNKQRIGTSETC
jgi:hypothetical protein